MSALIVGQDERRVKTARQSITEQKPLRINIQIKWTEKEEEGGRRRKKDESGREREREKEKTQRRNNLVDKSCRLETCKMRQTKDGISIPVASRPVNDSNPTSTLTIDSMQSNYMPLNIH